MRTTLLLSIGLLASLLAAGRNPRAAGALAQDAAAGDRALVGPQECAECHERELDAWKDTAHEAHSRTLTRQPAAREMARALGVRRVTIDERCASCHYTVRSDAGSKRSLAGVSCESCHGPAEDWLELHDDFGAPDATIHTETPEHRRQRLARCEQAGMRHPDRLLDMAARCYDCHVIGDRELVEVAGHPTGEGFELVAWSQGEIRHNFVRGRGENAEASRERRRKMYVLGRLLELEHALRALARLETEGALSESLHRRAQGAGRALSEVAARLQGAGGTVSSELDGGLARAVEAADALAQQSPAELVERADALRAAAEALDERGAGAELAPIDALLPEPSDYRGDPPR